MEIDRVISLPRTGEHLVLDLDARPAGITDETVSLPMALCAWVGRGAAGKKW